MYILFGGLGGNNGRQSLMKDDVLVALSPPGPTHHMLLGVIGPLIVGVAKYCSRDLLRYAILAAMSAPLPGIVRAVVVVVSTKVVAHT